MSAEVRDDCVGFAALVSAYADGELAGDDLAAVEAHLEACAECRGRVEAYREMDLAAADAGSLRAPEVGAAEWERRGAEIERSLDHRAGRGRRAVGSSWFRRVAWGFAVAAAAVIMLAVFFPGDLGQNGGPPESGGAVAEVISCEAEDDYEVAVRYGDDDDSVAVIFIAEDAED